MTIIQLTTREGDRFLLNTDAIYIVHRRAFMIDHADVIEEALQDPTTPTIDGSPIIHGSMITTTDRLGLLVQEDPNEILARCYHHADRADAHLAKIAQKLDNLS